MKNELIESYLNQLKLDMTNITKEYLNDWTCVLKDKNDNQVVITNCFQDINVLTDSEVTTYCQREVRTDEGTKLCWVQGSNFLI